MNKYKFPDKETIKSQLRNCIGGGDFTEEFSTELENRELAPRGVKMVYELSFASVDLPSIAKTVLDISAPDILRAICPNDVAFVDECIKLF